MRRLTLLLCLLLVAALRWIIRSAEAPTTTEQNVAVLSKTYVIPEAENMGFEATSVAASIRAEDAAWMTHKLVRPAIEVRPRSASMILSRIGSTRGIRIYRDRR